MVNVNDYIYHTIWALGEERTQLFPRSVRHVRGHNATTECNLGFSRLLETGAGNYILGFPYICRNSTHG